MLTPSGQSGSAQLGPGGEFNRLNNYHDAQPTPHPQTLMIAEPLESHDNNLEVATPPSPEAAAESDAFTEIYLVRIGISLRVLRNLKQMTLKELSEASGVSSSQISKWETKGMNGTLRDLFRLSSALGVDAPTILNSALP